MPILVTWAPSCFSPCSRRNCRRCSSRRPRRRPTARRRRRRSCRRPKRPRRSRRRKERIAALTREADVLKRQSASVLDELRRLDVERDAAATPGRARPARPWPCWRPTSARSPRDRRRLQATLDRERPAVAARLRRLQRLGRVGYARIAWNASSARDVGRAARLMNYLAKDDGRRLAAYTQTADATSPRRAGSVGDVAGTRPRALRRGGRGSRRAAAEAAYARKQELLASLEQETGQRERWLAELVAARGPPRRVDDQPAVGAGRRRRCCACRSPRVDGSCRGRSTARSPAASAASATRGSAPAPSATASPSRPALGTPVRALHPGTVVFAGAFTGFGQLVIVDHGQQAYSLYGYLSTVRVQRGTTVEAGALVGDVGDAPDGDAGAVSRGARRRSSGRSPTMAETTVAGSTASAIRPSAFVIGCRHHGISNDHPHPHPRADPDDAARGVHARRRPARPAAHGAGRVPAPARLRRRGVADLRQLRRGAQPRHGARRRDARAGRGSRSRQLVPRCRPGEAARVRTRRRRRARPACRSPASTTCASSPRATGPRRPRPACTPATTSAPSTASPRDTCRCTRASACCAGPSARRSR